MVLDLDPRVTGFPGVQQGGYVAGELARAAGEPLELRLRRPLAPGARLEVGDDGALQVDGEPVGHATPARPGLSAPPPEDVARALEALDGFRRPGAHPVPECYVCGLRHDGLGIACEAPTGLGVAIGRWVPPGAGPLPEAIVGAALDCVGYWGLAAALEDPDPAACYVSASLVAEVHGPVVAGRPHAVVGWAAGGDRDRPHVGASIHGPDGELLALGEQVLARAPWGFPPARGRQAMGLGR